MTYREGAEKYCDLFGEKQDGPFYLDLARKHGRKALELGVGTARLAIQLARAGVEVWGIDNSPHMLRAAEANLVKEEPDVRRRVHLEQADVREFNLPERFGLVYFPSFSFDHLRPAGPAARRGSTTWIIGWKLPPETLNDNSPLIRDSRSQNVKPIGERQIYQLVHALYFKAGLLKPDNANGYDLHVHSLRKYFKTQLMALDVQSDYIDYMMGHTVGTYHDIESKGIEFLRNIYANAGLSIKPKAQASKIDMVKEFIRGLGMNPEKILTRQALQSLTESTPTAKNTRRIRLERFA